MSRHRSPTSRRHALALACALLFAASARAQEAPPPAAPPAPPAGGDDAKKGDAPEKQEKKDEKKEVQLDWQPDWPVALRSARDVKKPLLVVFAADGEGSETAAKLWREEKLAEKAGAFVCVLACPAKHEESAVDGGPLECARFGRVACAAHQQCLVAAARELIGAGEPLLPQQVICTGEGRILMRRAYEMKLTELTKAMEMALRVVAADPKADAAQVAGLLKEAEKARAGRKDDLLRKALDLGGEAALGALLDYARKGDDDTTRVALIDVLATRGDYLVLEALLKLTRDGKQYVAIAAVDALGKVALPEAKEELRKLLPGFTGNDLGHVLRALAACGPDDPAVRELIVKKIKGNDQNVRAHALVAVGAMKPVPELEAVLKKAIFDRLTIPRACATYAAGKGRFEKCRDELAKLASTETNVDMKELADTALAHLDHDPADEKCCNLAEKLGNFFELGGARR